MNPFEMEYELLFSILYIIGKTRTQLKLNELMRNIETGHWGTQNR
jgi:hypothetical protein